MLTGEQQNGRSAKHVRLGVRSEKVSGGGGQGGSSPATSRGASTIRSDRPEKLTTGSVSRRAVITRKVTQPSNLSPKRISRARVACRGGGEGGLILCQFTMLSHAATFVDVHRLSASRMKFHSIWSNQFAQVPIISAVRTIHKVVSNISTTYLYRCILSI